MDAPEADACSHPPYHRRRMYDYGKLRVLWCNMCGAVCGDPECFKETPWFVPISSGGPALSKYWLPLTIGLPSQHAEAADKPNVRQAIRKKAAASGEAVWPVAAPRRDKRKVAKKRRKHSNKK